MKEIHNSRWYKKWWGVLIIIALILFFAFVFASFLYIIKISRNQPASLPNSTSKNEYDSGLINGSDSNYHIGAKNPQVTIVEFADFACPYCLESFPVIRELSIKYKDEIKIIYRDYPVITDYSADLSLAARCGGEQGLFWVMYDKLFINQGVSGNDNLLKLAAQIGADTDRFKGCMENKKYLPDIEKDFSDGQALGIQGTPTWFINGNKIEGHIPIDIFKNIINSLIK